MTLGQNGVLRYGHLGEFLEFFFGDRMADLGLIDFKLGLYIKVNVNNGQNKFEVHITKNVAKMAILWPKIGQRHFGARASHGHNLATFHPILTNEYTKMTNSLRRIEWNKKLSSISLLLYIGFLAPFLLRGLTWALLYVWTQNYPQVVGTCPGHHGQLMSQNCVLTKIRAEPPPPPPPPLKDENIISVGVKSGPWTLFGYEKHQFYLESKHR